MFPVSGVLRGGDGNWRAVSVRSLLTEMVV